MRKKKGFTLVELLIVVLILAALAAVAVPRISSSATSAKANACYTNIDIINGQIEIFTANTGAAPSPLTELTTDTNYFPDGPPTCPVTGAAYTLNAYDRVDTTAHDHGE